MFIVPSALVIGSLNGESSMMSFDGSLESQALISQISHNARVAIYDEDNLTAPVICKAENLTNNIAEITTLLEDAGHTVDALTEADILNHELITADYDIFILVNNVPRPSISKLVKEFWLGGGGLLSFNGAMSFLWYEGVLYPEVALDPRPASWDYRVSDELNVTARHPTMKDFHINDTVTLAPDNWPVIAQLAIDGSDLSNYFTTLLNNATETNYVSAFALDSRYEGGRVVHLPGTGASIATDMESIITDSVDWLIPRPKGRIAFDYSHQPRIGIDSWDTPYITVYSTLHNYEDFRTLATNHSYTFDKLYPSTTGNLTAERLAKYDVLILNYPDLNYTSAEMTAVDNWVAGGGSLLVLGDRTGMIGPNRGDLAINNLLQDFDMSLGTTDILADASMTPETHVTLEGCSSLSIGFRNYLVVIGNATEIWMDGTNCVVAGEEYGLGRAILVSDMNIFDNDYLPEQSNTRYALNVLDWLSAVDAEILVHTDYLGSNDPVCWALRDLGLPYQLFTTRQYLDDFVDSKSWELLIYNNVNWFPESTIYDALYAYVNTGGRLLMTYFGVDDHPTHPLWSKLGVEYDTTVSGQPSMYLWDASHPIFTEPNNRDGYNFTSDGPFSDDGDSVTVQDGYIALAGTTGDAQAGKATIVVSSDKQTLFNSIIIDNFSTDEDDSTYMDSIELWQNEITFMLTPIGGGFPLDTTTLLIIGGAAFALILVLALVARRRGGGGSKPKKKKKSKKKK